MSFLCPQNMVNFGPLSAEIGWRVWGTPVNFNGFRVFASLLHRRRSTEVNQTLLDVWPSPGLLYYIYFFGGYCGILPGAKFNLRPSLRSAILVALLHGTRAVGVNHTLRRRTRKGITELAPHSTERPSRWEPAHILVKARSLVTLVI